MSKGNTTENDMLQATLKGVDPAWRSGANLYIALHTADPGEGGVQTTSECTWGAYARRLVVKATDWVDGGSSFSNGVLWQYLECTSGTEVITHFSLGTTLAAAGQIIYKGALTTPRTVSAGIQPQWAIGAMVITED